MTGIQEQVRARIDAFAAELEALVFQAALEQIEIAFGGAVPTQRTRAAAPRKAKAKATRRAKAAPERGRRGSIDKEGVAAKALSIIQAKGDVAMGDLSRAVGATPVQLRPLLQELASEGKVHSTGQRRGTLYHPGAGGRAAAAKKKATGKKKTAAKRVVRKKAAKKTTTTSKAA